MAGQKPSQICLTSATRRTGTIWSLCPGGGPEPGPLRLVAEGQPVLGWWWWWWPDLVQLLCAEMRKKSAQECATSAQN